MHNAQGSSELFGSGPQVYAAPKTKRPGNLPGRTFLREKVYHILNFCQENFSAIEKYFLAPLLSVICGEIFSTAEREKILSDFGIFSDFQHFCARFLAQLVDSLRVHATKNIFSEPRKPP
jgi:hypothetical protein